jgi:acetyl esterase/lipase
MALYAGGHDYSDPLLSPVYADYSKGFPPTILTTGTRDLLLSSTVMLHRAMRRGGVDAHLHVWEAMTHAPFFGAPEERELYDETARFLLAHMGSD